MRTANLQEQPGRTPVLVLGASGGHEGAVAEVMMRACLPVRAFIQDPGKTAARRLAVAGAQRAAGESTDQDGMALARREAARAFALTTPNEVLRVLIACC